MANAKKCDRCGMLYEEAKEGIRNVLVTKTKEGGKYKEIICDTFTFDLCSNCADVFDSWLKNKEFENKNFYDTTSKILSPLANLDKSREEKCEHLPQCFGNYSGTNPHCAVDSPTCKCQNICVDEKNKIMNEINSIILVHYLREGQILSKEEAGIEREKRNKGRVNKRPEDDNAKKFVDLTIDAGHEDEDEKDSWE